VLARIGDAALTVCGAPQSSLADVKLAVRRSACWKDAVAGAMAQIDDPLLAQAYRDLHRS
jgi:UrcA family protein